MLPTISRTIEDLRRVNAARLSAGEVCPDGALMNREDFRALVSEYRAGLGEGDGCLIPAHPSRLTLSGLVVRPTAFMESGRVAWLVNGQVVAISLLYEEEA